MAPPPHESNEAFVHPAAGHARKKKVSPYGIEPIKIFYCFLAANLVAACFAPIQDCDETFNYWEPAHYLSHGYGLQTWEYSPEFAIRSWLYVGLHAIVANVRRLLPGTSKVAEFYFVRYFLAIACALAQTLLFRAISLTLNPRVGLFYVVALILSPGNFHASTAFLPSSFAMIAAMVGTAAFMNWRGGIKTSLGLTWFGVGAILGWPFAMALAAPFVLEEVVIAAVGDGQRKFESAFRLFRGGVACLLLVVADTLINTFFYKKMEIIPWNIVNYNIFSKSGGPDLYGTEPWTFYFKNLTLNFNLWFILALLALPLFILQRLLSDRKPHKEERFMYPAYPFLALNAAISVHVLLSVIGTQDPKSLVAKIPAKLRLLGVSAVFLLATGLGLARIYGVVSAYSAPMKLYEPLGAGVRVVPVPVIVLPPRDMHAKFVRSEFRGLLPGEFSEAKIGFGFWSGTWLPTNGLNDRNEEDPGKYVDTRACHFLVDTQYPLHEGELPPNEPDYVVDKENWEVVQCLPFLDASRTHPLARMLWVPDSSAVPDKFRRKWANHCLLRRKS
ncbi:unnamed protein product [Parascedosporium putredinis]|uniref:Mannosyltransferase n=1 Tax=Parascedosporium putredinis TaxID=1442378 RepID=A0A9P1H2R2_9PEZI|nr:unnamed protein product [Parascedosporium putredinis]CAI7995138.1 unnamed protein product [Parascedosporium putredinis]